MGSMYVGNSPERRKQLATFWNSVINEHGIDFAINHYATTYKKSKERAKAVLQALIDRSPVVEKPVVSTSKSVGWEWRVGDKCYTYTGALVKIFKITTSGMLGMISGKTGYFTFSTDGHCKENATYQLNVVNVERGHNTVPSVDGNNPDTQKTSVGVVTETLTVTQEELRLVKSFLKSIREGNQR